MHAGSDDLLQMMQRLTALRKDYRRDREFFEIRVISFDAFTVDGVTDVIVGFRNPYDRETDAMTLTQKIDALRRFADDVIAKCS